jgi:hypothetical protein
MADLKIKLDKDPETGEDRVPPECMRILLDFAGHRDTCDVCGPAWIKKHGKYCVTGESLMEELLSQPGVSFV